jgi:hypothetical protein
VFDRIRSRLLPACAAAFLVSSIGGCSLIGRLDQPRGGPYPEACAQWEFSARRCEAIVDRAVEQAHLDPSDIAGALLLPVDDGAASRRVVAIVGLELTDGGTVEEEIACPGIRVTLACTEIAEIQAHFGVNTDVPCLGEPPAGCATLPPTPDPDAVGEAQPLEVAALDVPLDRLGKYEVEVGKAALPNGYLTERSFWLDNRNADTFWIDEGVLLEVRPDIAGRPWIGSVYRDPFDGPEPVTVYLSFEVTDLDAASVLRVRDVIVR